MNLRVYAIRRFSAHLNCSRFVNRDFLNYIRITNDVTVEYGKLEHLLVFITFLVFNFINRATVENVFTTQCVGEFHLYLPYLYFRIVMRIKL